MKKIISIILIVIALIYLTFTILKSPHSMDTKQTLMNFSWTLKQNNKKEINDIHFNKKLMIINKDKIHYEVDSEDNLTIDSGRYKGTYSMNMDSTDYNLLPNDKNNESLKLIRQ